jgi:PAS domain S-box-containing protein
MDLSPEEQRLHALESYNIVDADISDALDGLVELASNICGAPISLVNLVGASQQVTKARRGLDITEIPREDSFCQHTIMGEGLMVVEDARSDARFKDNPLVTGDPNIRFYAGMPLESADGHNLGAVCLIDRKPRQLSEDQQRTLELVAEEVSARLELIKSTHILQEQNSALKKSDLFIQNSSDVQAIVDPGEGTILEVNGEALELYECRRQDLIGHPYVSWIPDGAIRAEMQQFLGQTDRPSGSMVTPITTDNDRELYLEHSFTLHEGLWYATARDITARKKTEKQLENSRENLKRAQQIAQMGSWELNLSTMHLSWSDQVYELFGLSRTAFNPTWQKFLDLVPPDDRDQLQKGLHDAIEAHAERDIQHKIITASGEERHVIERGQVDYDGDGNPVKMSGTIQDITQQKETELELSKRSEAIESSIDGIAISNANGEYVYMNPAYASIFGYDSPEDLMGKPWALLYDEEKAELFEEEIMPVLQKQGKWRGEGMGMCKDGSSVPHELSLTHVEGGGLICVARDITERKEAQLQLQQSLDEKDMLLAEIHHRVKNNLAIISGLLELEAYKTDEAATRRVLENSTMRIKSMAVVHEMLYQADDFNTLNFKAFVPKVIEAIKGAHPPKGQAITFEADVDDIILNVNQAIPCGLIINELVTNAYQHGFEGGAGGHIRVALAESPAGICLQVSDSGTGLPPGFSPDGGSLGFTLIKTLAKQLKGEFSYTSEPKTTFSLRFGKRNGKGSASALPAGYAP